MTDATPSISLTLTNTTCREHVDAWLRATRKLAHAPKLTVTIHGSCSPAALDLLLARLATRGPPRTLVIRGAPHPMMMHQRTASIPAACLARLAGAEQLVLHDVCLSGTSDQLLTPLASSAGAASLHLLDLGASWAGGASLQAAAASLSSLSALSRLEELRCGLPAAAVRPPPAALAGLIGSAGDVGEQLRSAVTGVLAPLLALRQLRVLQLSGLPDMWGPRAMTNNRVTEQAAADDDDGTVPRALEALGAQLATGLPHLRSLDVSLVGGWGMGWGAAEEVDDSGCGGVLAGTGSKLQLAKIHAVVNLAQRNTAAAAAVSAPAAAAAAAVSAPAAAAAVAASAPAAAAATAAAAVSGPAAPAPAEGSTATVVSIDMLRGKFDCLLAAYLTSPPAAVAASVHSLHLTVPTSDVSQLPALLASLPSLCNLRLCAMATSAAGAAPLAALLAAAACAPHLESLVVIPGLAPAEISAASLAPLLSMGNRLRSLKVVGPLHVSGSPEAAWLPVAQLRGLRRLAVHHVGSGKVKLPGSCLPPGLQAVDFKGVHVVATGSGGNAATAANDLRSVHLVGCSVDGVSLAGLAGTHVEEAVVAGSHMGGGSWAAAARAWPQLTSLRVSCEGDELAANALLAVLPNFRHLEALQLQRLPALDDAALATLLAPACLRQLAVSANQCDVSSDGIAGLDAVAGVDSPPQVRSLALQLPARHLPAQLLQMLAGGQPAAAGADGARGVAAALPWWALSEEGVEGGDDAVALGGRPGGRLQGALQSLLPGAAVGVQLNQAPVAYRMNAVRCM